MNYNNDYLPINHSFINVGGICWLNSILQALLSCPIVNETLKKRSNKTPLMKAYCDLIGDIHSHRITHPPVEKTNLTPYILPAPQTMPAPQVNIRKIRVSGQPKTDFRLINADLPSGVSKSQIRLKAPYDPKNLPAGFDRSNIIKGAPKKITIPAENIKSTNETNPNTTQHNDICVSSNKLNTTNDNIKFANLFEQDVKSKGITLSMNSEGALSGLLVLIDLLEINDLFTVEYEKTIKCPNCNHIVKTIDKYNTVEIFSKNGLIGQFIQYHEEDLEDYVCEECKEKKIIKIKSRLVKLSEVVIVSMCNLNSYKGKVRIPSKLNHHMMVAHLEHNGTLNEKNYTSSGHWWAHCKRGNNSYKLNDSLGEKSPLSPNRQTTKIIIYHLI